MAGQHGRSASRPARYANNIIAPSSGEGTRMYLRALYLLDPTRSSRCICTVSTTSVIRANHSSLNSVSTFYIIT